MSIIVGYIPTPEGRAALHRAADEAKLRRTKLVVVNSHRGSDFDAEESLALEREFEDMVRDLRADGIEHEMRTLVRGNEPAADLIAVAAEADADFIVIGLRKRSPVGKLLLGSNAQTILLEADCPVLAVKAR